MLWPSLAAHTLPKESPKGHPRRNRNMLHHSWSCDTADVRHCNCSAAVFAPHKNMCYQWSKLSKLELVLCKEEIKLITGTVDCPISWCICGK